jgi:hypothetical protein
MAAAASDKIGVAASDKIEVAAFIMMHAGIYLEGPVQIHTHASGKDSPAPYHYSLDASVVPYGINLYAPSILGYSYYDSLKSVGFLHETNRTYLLTSPPPRQKYIEYWLEQIKSFEEQHVAETTESLNSGEIPDDQRDKRNLYRDMETLKPRVNWKKHTHYITQKTYAIDAHSKHRHEPPSSIIFCCQEDLLEESVEKATRALQSNPKFNVYNCVCAYDRPRRTFSIHFMAEQNIMKIPFVDIILRIIRTVVRAVLDTRRYNLSIFDFTCSEVDFLGLPHTEQPLTPVFLSYNESENTMIYGTNPTESFNHHEYNKLHLLRAGPGDASPAPLRSQFKTDKGPSCSPSPAHQTSLIYVQLDEHIKTFVDLNTCFEPRSRSISPPGGRLGGRGGRARNRKKTRRRRITRRRRNGRFRAKSSTRRTRK